MLGRFAGHFARSPVSFDIVLPDKTVQHFGPDAGQGLPSLHTGAVEIRGEEYFGAPLHRCARLMDTAHGGQIVLSAATGALVGETLPPTTHLKDLGEHHLRDTPDESPPAPEAVEDGQRDGVGRDGVGRDGVGGVHAGQGTP